LAVAARTAPTDTSPATGTATTGMVSSVSGQVLNLGAGIVFAIKHKIGQGLALHCGLCEPGSAARRVQRGHAGSHYGRCLTWLAVLPAKPIFGQSTKVFQ
jgi:hypothetical protein